MRLWLGPTTGELVDGGVEEQSRQALTNVKNVLAVAGSNLEKVVKTTYCTVLIEVYETYVLSLELIGK